MLWQAAECIHIDCVAHPCCYFKGLAIINIVSHTRKTITASSYKLLPHIEKNLALRGFVCEQADT